MAFIQAQHQLSKPGSLVPPASRLPEPPVPTPPASAREAAGVLSLDPQPPFSNSPNSSHPHLAKAGLPLFPPVKTQTLIIHHMDTRKFNRFYILKRQNKF